MIRKTNGVKSELKDDILVVLFDINEIKLYNAPTVYEALYKLIKESEKKFTILDMKNIEGMDSSGIGILVSLYGKIGVGKIFIISCCESVKRTLHIVNLASLFNICDSIKDVENIIEEKYRGLSN